MHTFLKKIDIYMVGLVHPKKNKMRAVVAPPNL